jgi:hypothetical protein
MNFFLGAGGGFLLAVLWMDLMFDVLVFTGRPEDELSEDTLAQIAAYYRRVTTNAAPMNSLIRVVMTVMVLMLVTRLVRADGSRTVDGISLALCGIPIALALLRIVPNAVRLGSRTDGLDEQSRLAREICSAHLVCLAAVSSFVALRWIAGS